MQDKARLYNNLASFKECSGRLQVELEIYPVPRLAWEFELLGGLHRDFPHGDIEPSQAFQGHQFKLDGLVGVNFSFAETGPAYRQNGIAKSAIYGDELEPAHYFDFYLPNMRLQHHSHNQGRLRKTVSELETERRVFYGGEGYYIEVELNDAWKLKLVTKNDALEWLKPEAGNRGSYLTTKGYLSQPNYASSSQDASALLPSLSLKEAKQRLNNLCSLLALANGGDLAPVYIEAHKYSQMVSHAPSLTIVAAIAQGLRITPVEQLGRTWVSHRSDLAAYIRCLNTFERMLSHQYWQETYAFVLIQYHRATNQAPWPVAASAIAAVLERLAFTILVDEESDPTVRENVEYLFRIKQPDHVRSRVMEYWRETRPQAVGKQTRAAVQLLLERIGLTKTRGYSDTELVYDVLELRNDAVHPRSLRYSSAERSKLLRKALQWVEEVMLWRLDYIGEYRDRSQEGPTSIAHRYDLSTRDPLW